MTSMRKTDEEAFRAFVTRTADVFRPPYGRTLESFPRRCVFIGTSNDEPLDDVHGMRRYWPMNVGEKIDIEWFEQNVHQLWAEAVEAYRSGEQWWFTNEERALIEPEVNMFQREEPISEAIRDWFERCPKAQRPAEVTHNRIVVDALGLTGKDATDRSIMIRCGKALKLMGFEKIRSREPGSRRYCYKTPEHVLTGVVKRTGPVQLVRPAEEKSLE